MHLFKINSYMRLFTSLYGSLINPVLTTVEYTSISTRDCLMY